MSIKILLSSILLLFLFAINVLSWDVHPNSKNNTIELEIFGDNSKDEFVKVVILKNPSWVIFNKREVNILLSPNNHNSTVAKFSFDISESARIGDNGNVEFLIIGSNGVWKKIIELNIKPKITDILSIESSDERKFATSLPQETSLKQNYPNPFNFETEINYQIGYSTPKAIDLNLSIYNIQGELVRELISSPQESGYYKVRWDGKDQYGNESPSGVYFYKMKAGGFTQIRKAIKIK